MKTISKETELIINYLSRYGCLKLDQLKELFSYNADEFKDILDTLEQEKIILIDKELNVANLVPTNGPNEKIITSFWVMLRFVKDIHSTINFMAEYPCSIHFINEDIVYEIIVINEGEEYLLNMLKPYNTEPTSLGIQFGYNNKPKNKVKYIVVVQDECKIPEIKKRINTENLIFAKMVSGSHVDFL